MPAHHPARRYTLLSCAVSATLAIALLVPTARAVASSSIVVDTTANSLAVDGHCSLREAILAANTRTIVDTCAGHRGLNVVSLPAGRYVLALPGRDEDAARIGDLDVTGRPVVRGAGAVATLIDANAIDRVFDIATGATVRLVDLTTTGGSTREENTCCGSAADDGGAIANHGSLTLWSSRVMDSESGSSGGGIFSSGTLTLRASSVIDNSAPDGAGGISSTGPLEIRDSRIAGNRTTQMGSSVQPHRDDPGQAAGIDSRQPLTLVHSVVARNVGNGEWTIGGISMLGGTISDSTIRGNVGTDCGSGGVVMIWGLIERSTISGNSAGECDGTGGVVAIDSQIWNSTISGNSAGGPYSPGGSTQVGGVLSDVSTIVGSTITRNVNRTTTRQGSGPGGLLARQLSPPAFAGNLAAVRDTILAGNRDADGNRSDCEGLVTSDGHNLVGAITGCAFVSRRNDRLGAKAMLGPLADNGGPTLTHLPMPGSAAIDAWAVTGGDTDCPTTDQRGLPRPMDGDGDSVAACDIGAVEVAGR